MDTFWQAALGSHLEAAIDMLENAIRACPDEVWCDNSRRPAWVANDVVGFWYVTYHTLFFLDLDFSDSIEDFGPPASFNRDEFDPAGLLPDAPYSKKELLGYLDHSRKKCRTFFETLTEEKARQQSRIRPEQNLTIAERLVLNLRHVQHHAAQLNLILRQKTGSAPQWVNPSRK